MTMPVRAPLGRGFLNGCLIALALYCCHAAWPAPAAAGQRFLFDEDLSWLTEDGADRLVKRAVDAGFTAIVPCVWHGNGASWPSRQAPKDPRWERHAAPHPDPLRYLIAQAHANGVQIHPWFTVTLRPGSLLPEFADSGTPEKAFNAHLPAFRSWIVTLILEVVTHYDVDGVNLDYVRTRGQCTARSCERSYQATQGRDLRADLLSRSFNQAARDALSAWNGAAIGDIVERVSREARRIRPSLLISVDSLAGDPLWMEQGAHGLSWVEHRWIDLLFHMDYGDPLNAQFLARLKPRVADPKKVAILVGNYAAERTAPAAPRPRTGADTARLVRQARDLWPDSGVTALYEYRFLSDEQITVLQEMNRER